ncbi:MAG TPA: sulfatase [Cytophagales bacterium]|jgi:N-sulfoglucosamine sulfohydrolase|nr:sulfatase [Cytophagales bacterium]
MIRNILFCLVALLVFWSCNSKKGREAINYETVELPERPNIVWIVAEDLSPVIPVFGDSTVKTPHISRLAEEGVTYTNFYSPSGVCAPSRAAIATGMYPTRIGAHHMRTGPWFRFTIKDQAIKNYSRKAYEAMPPAGTHMMSAYLRKNGYYCSNNPKEDYQFRSEMTAWDESSFDAHWKNRKPGQPFFAIFNLDVTHESMLWRKESDSLWVDEELEVPVPPYLPSTEPALKDIRRMYSNVKEMDRRVGHILHELDSAGLLDNTIVFWYTDHGGPLPRQKRTIYHSGLHSPLIIRFPNGQFAGEVDDQLLSFIDLKPTVMSLLGMRPPDYVDGKAWMGDYMVDEPRDYLYASADRFDNQTDKIRAVFDKRYKLVRYYNTEQPYYLPVKYREEMDIMKELLRMRQAGELNQYQAQWFRATKDSIELFDLKNDPHELHNLARDPHYQRKISELRTRLDHWIAEMKDKGMMPEEKYIASIWPSGQQPVTSSPEISVKGGAIELKSETEGASIGYQWANHASGLTNSWEIYTEAIKPHKGDTLYARAHRIGYRPSGMSKKGF